MRRSSSHLATTSSPSAKRPKMVVSRNTTVNVDVTDSGQEVVTIPRSYQTELVEQAKKENLVVCLPTGSGKTYIAVMLIKEMAHEVRRRVDDGGKRTVFLVKTVALVQQQSDYIRIHTDLSVGKYYGELKVDLWDKERWIDEFEQHQVLIFTAQVFLNLVDHNFFPLYKVNLLIFDECHHSKGENCYAALMNRHYNTCHNPPRILGLTASISAQKIKPDQLRLEARKIEETYRARVASGSNREESNRYGTSVSVEPIFCLTYKEHVCKQNESITIAFDIIQSILLNIEPYLKEKKAQRQQMEYDLSEVILTTDYLSDNIANYNANSIDYTIFLQSEYVNVPRLKRYLTDLIHMGYELGIYGLFIGAKALRERLKLSQMFELINDPKGKELFDDAVERIDCLVDDILNNLVNINQGNNDILFSGKVLEVFQRLKNDVDKNNLGRCIVFVERVDIAYVLSEILAFLSKRQCLLNSDHLKIKYLTGTKASLGEIPMTAKYLRQVIKEFRTGEINVLIATAVVEEGIDIPKCNLVFRFNKPPNFSSYMQSKGRARARQNASYVVLLDELDEKTFLKDSIDYRNYEEIEKMLQEGFSIGDDDVITHELNQLECYRTDNGVVISAVRAAQILYEYCAFLGNGRACPPRILFYATDNRRFKSILSMPANCPVRDDIICENTSKKLAKFECCLKMVKLLHQRGELNEDCLPRHTHSLMTIDIPIENQLFEEKSDSAIETFPKQIACFPSNSNISENIWHLYRINIQSERDKLGFVVPSKLADLPFFNIHGAANELFIVDIIYVKTIDYTKYGNDLERFCRYLFENVFDGIINSSEMILQFDLEHSPFKLLPCLLKDFDEIDGERMLSICNRLNKPIEHLSHLSDTELYVAWHLSYKPLYIKMPGVSMPKRTSDPWKHKKKLDTIKTYADYFQDKVPNCSIQRDSLMAEMKAVNKPRINYLYQSLSGTKTNENHIVSTSDQHVYYPIELLHYAPVNQSDLQLLYKLPSILVRITQLYYTEQLRRLFASSINSYSMIEAKRIRTAVSFTDYLKTTDSPPTTSFPVPRQIILPLVSLTYDSSMLMNEIQDQQPLPDILFQAITRRSSGEQMDNENLEVLGDCFLKLAVSISLYYRHSLASAGLLTVEKIKQISNNNLYRLAVKKELKPYLNVKKIVFRGKDANWLPPGYKVDQTKKVLGERYTHQTAKRKAFSDMVEAFIGAFLIASNYTTTIKFMHWLGLDVIPLDGLGHEMKTPSIIRASTADNIDNSINQIIYKFYTDQGFDQIETKINYVFHNKAYLIAAFTHPSNFSNRITDCYERLEFLGDAVLDFLVTRYVFVNYNQNVSPGRVTDIRQDLANNGRIAYIFVACGLQTKILHNSTDLFSHISSYAGNEDLFPRDQSTDQYLNKDLDQWADTTAPKALADVFEALVGAIFLDSGNSLEAVWSVLEPLLRQYIERSINHPNLNPVRSFFEHGGKEIKETIDESGDTRITICTVQLPGEAQVEGRGTNNRKAKADACRKAMKAHEDHAHTDKGSKDTIND